MLFVGAVVPAANLIPRSGGDAAGPDGVHEVVFAEYLTRMTREFQQNAHHPVFELRLFSCWGYHQTLRGLDCVSLESETLFEPGRCFAVGGALIHPVKDTELSWAGHPLVPGRRGWRLELRPGWPRVTFAWSVLLQSGLWKR